MCHLLRYLVTDTSKIIIIRHCLLMKVFIWWRVLVCPVRNTTETNLPIHTEVLSLLRSISFILGKSRRFSNSVELLCLRMHTPVRACEDKKEKKKPKKTHLASYTHNYFKTNAASNTVFLLLLLCFLKYKGIGRESY